MTFLEAYAAHGPDVERIAELLGITPPEADSLINDEMEHRHALKLVKARREQNARYREQIRGIRAGRLA